jgi:hypothetical protein
MITFKKLDGLIQSSIGYQIFIWNEAKKVLEIEIMVDVGGASTVDEDRGASTLKKKFTLEILLYIHQPLSQFLPQMRMLIDCSASNKIRKCGNWLRDNRCAANARLEILYCLKKQRSNKI